MHIVKKIFNDVLLLAPEVYKDDRGYFFESFRQDFFEEATGKTWLFPQDNVSRSQQGVIRGMHYQLHTPNGKLVRVSAGKIMDVVVDIRKSSPTFGKWQGCELSADNCHQLWVPPGFAHGFITLSEFADVLYRTTEYHNGANQRAIRWNDPDVAIEWPISMPPIVSERDAAAPMLNDSELP